MATRHCCTAAPKDKETHGFAEAGHRSSRLKTQAQDACCQGSSGAPTMCESQAAGLCATSWLFQGVVNHQGASAPERQDWVLVDTTPSQLPRSPAECLHLPKAQTTETWPQASASCCPAIGTSLGARPPWCDLGGNPADTPSCQHLAPAGSPVL